MKKTFTAVIDGISALSMFGLTAIIILLVVCRFLDVSVSSLSELPTYLLYLNVWMAAIVNAQDKGGHISLDFIGLVVKNKRFKKISEIVLLVIGTAALGLFAYCTVIEVVNLMNRSIITAGMKMPLWWIYAVVCFSAGMMAFSNLLRIVQAIKEVAKE